MNHAHHLPHAHHATPVATGTRSLDRIALSATLHCLLGCALGLAGGVCLHIPRIREALSRPLRRLFNARPT